VISHDATSSTDRHDIARHRLQTIITYVGAYDDMVRAKAQVRSRVESENADKMKRREQAAGIRGALLRRHSRSQVRAPIKQLEKLSLLRHQEVEHRPAFIKFEQKRPSGKQTLTSRGSPRASTGKPLFKGFSALITKGEKVAIVGATGSARPPSFAPSWRGEA